MSTSLSSSTTLVSVIWCTKSYQSQRNISKHEKQKALLQLGQGLPFDARLLDPDNSCPRETIVRSLFFTINESKAQRNTGGR